MDLYYLNSIYRYYFYYFYDIFIIITFFIFPWEKQDPLNPQSITILGGRSHLCTAKAYVLGVCMRVRVHALLLEVGLVRLSVAHVVRTIPPVMVAPVSVHVTGAGWVCAWVCALVGRAVAVTGAVQVVGARVVVCLCLCLFLCRAPDAVCIKCRRRGAVRLTIMRAG